MPTAVDGHQPSFPRIAPSLRNCPTSSPRPLLFTMRITSLPVERMEPGKGGKTRLEARASTKRWPATKLMRSRPSGQRAKSLDGQGLCQACQGFWRARVTERAATRTTPSDASMRGTVRLRQGTYLSSPGFLLIKWLHRIHTGAFYAGRRRGDGALCRYRHRRKPHHSASGADQQVHRCRVPAGYYRLVGNDRVRASLSPVLSQRTLFLILQPAGQRPASAATAASLVRGRWGSQIRSATRLLAKKTCSHRCSRYLASKRRELDFCAVAAEGV